MIKTLVTCPVCKTDQHVYAKRVCKHVGDGGINCLGSKTLVKDLPLDRLQSKQFPGR